MASPGSFSGGEFVYLFRQSRQRYQMFDALKLCWDPVSNVAEVWCCSEHYLRLSDGDLYLDPFTAVYCCCAVISEDAKTT